MLLFPDDPPLEALAVASYRWETPWMAPGVCAVTRLPPVTQGDLQSVLSKFQELKIIKPGMNGARYFLIGHTTDDEFLPTRDWLSKSKNYRVSCLKKWYAKSEGNFLAVGQLLHNIHPWPLDAKPTRGGNAGAVVTLQQLYGVNSIGDVCDILVIAPKTADTFRHCWKRLAVEAQLPAPMLQKVVSLGTSRARWLAANIHRGNIHDLLNTVETQKIYQLNKETPIKPVEEELPDEADAPPPGLTAVVGQLAELVQDITDRMGALEYRAGVFEMQHTETRKAIQKYDKDVTGFLKSFNSVDSKCNRIEDYTEKAIGIVGKQLAEQQAQRKANYFDLVRKVGVLSRCIAHLAMHAPGSVLEDWQKDPDIRKIIGIEVGDAMASDAASRLGGS